MNLSFKPQKSSLILTLFLLILSVISLFIGVLDLDIKTLLQGHPEAWHIFLVSRLPRLLALLCTGAGMSVAGLIMQQLCMNKFVSPSTGATLSSAQMGILFALIFCPNFGLWGRALCSFAFAIAGTWIFVAFIQRVQFKSTAMVPLVGIMFGNVIGGVTSYFAFRFELNQALSSFLVGSFSGVVRGRYELVYIALPLIILAYLYSNHFNIVGMGKDFSKNLGVSYQLILFGGLTLAAVITAAIVAVVGSISYIGLIVPNTVSMFKGDRIRSNLLDTALFGCLFVVACDILARIIIPPYELPIGLISGILGSLIFAVFLIFRLKGRRPSFKLSPRLMATTSPCSDALAKALSSAHTPQPTNSTTSSASATSSNLLTDQSRMSSESDTIGEEQ